MHDLRHNPLLCICVAKVRAALNILRRPSDDGLHALRDGASATLLGALVFVDIPQPGHEFSLQQSMQIIDGADVLDEHGHQIPHVPKHPKDCLVIFSPADEGPADRNSEHANSTWQTLNVSATVVRMSSFHIRTFDGGMFLRGIVEHLC